MINMEIKCCGEILESEEGVNGSDFYYCVKCKSGYNITHSKVDEGGNVV